MVHEIPDLLARAARDVPERRALVESGGRSRTWQELAVESAEISAGLSGIGVRSSHRVMIALGNRIEFVSSYLGTLSAQAVAVPVNPASSAEQFALMIADSTSRVVIADQESLPALREALRLLVAARDDASARPVVRPIIVAVGDAPAPGEITWDDVRGVAQPAAPRSEDPERLAVLLYTVDLAGNPRAAMITHRALMANLDQLAQVKPALVHGDDVVLGALPLFHVYGLNAVLGSVLHSRAKLVLVEQWDPVAVLELVEDEACSVLPVAPPVFAHWLRAEHLRETLGPVRLVLSGSATLAADVVEQFHAATGLQVHQGYGLTEASPVVTSTVASPGASPGSVGVALPGVEVRTVDESGRPTSGADPRRLQIRGANLFSGYWPDGEGGPGEDGWWSTGDIGFFDASGDLVLVDPVDEVITVSGFKVYPSEVEDVLRAVDGVGAVAVVGLDDPVSGQSVVAHLQAPGSDAAAIRAAAQTAAAANLARFKRPGRYEVVDSLPLSGTGQVARGRVRGTERRRALGILE